MNLNKAFANGLEPEAYLATLDHHKDNSAHIYKQYQLPNDEDFFQAVKDKNMRIIVLAEVWCGHCMLNIPILLRLAEKTNMDIRFLPRDENLELMDQYLTNGNRTIPIFIFIDEQGNEIVQWGPVAPRTKAFVDQHKNKVPAKDAEDYEDKFKQFIKVIGKQFGQDTEIWDGVYESMKQTLEVHLHE